MHPLRLHGERGGSQRAAICGQSARRASALSNAWTTFVSVKGVSIDTDIPHKGIKERGRG